MIAGYCVEAFGLVAISVSPCFSKKFEDGIIILSRVIQVVLLILDLYPISSSFGALRTADLIQFPAAMGRAVLRTCSRWGST